MLEDKIRQSGEQAFQKACRKWRLDAMNERWREMWKDLWLAEFRKGWQEGRACALQEVLAARFGELPPWVQRRLEEASPQQLEDWSQRLLDSDGLEAMFEPGGKGTDLCSASGN